MCRKFQDEVRQRRHFGRNCPLSEQIGTKCLFHNVHVTPFHWAGARVYRPGVDKEEREVELPDTGGQSDLIEGAQYESDVVQ